MPEIVTLQRAAWREALLNLLAEGREMAPAPEWRASLSGALATEGVEGLVAEAGAELAGITVFGLNRDGVPGAGELRALFVHPDHWRSGVGTALVEGAVRGLACRYERVTLWSLRDNIRANAFYERVGFERDGATQTRPAVGVPEIRYGRSLRVVPPTSMGYNPVR